MLGLWLLPKDYPIIVIWGELVRVRSLGKEEGQVDEGNPYAYKTVSWKIIIAIKQIERLKKEEETQEKTDMEKIG